MEPVRCFLVESVEDFWREDGSYNVGAMRDHRSTGRGLIVVTPVGPADIATWKLSGEAPEITAEPSIRIFAHAGFPEWHGYLERGWLCLNRSDVPKP